MRMLALGAQHPSAVSGHNQMADETPLPNAKKSRCKDLYPTRPSNRSGSSLYNCVHGASRDFPRDSYSPYGLSATSSTASDYVQVRTRVSKSQRSTARRSSCRGMRHPQWNPTLGTEEPGSDICCVESRGASWHRTAQASCLRVRRVPSSTPRQDRSHHQ